MSNNLQVLIAETLAAHAAYVHACDLLEVNAAGNLARRDAGEDVTDEQIHAAVLRDNRAVWDAADRLKTALAKLPPLLKQIGEDPKPVLMMLHCLEHKGAPSNAKDLWPNLKVQLQAVALSADEGTTDKPIEILWLEDRDRSYKVGSHAPVTVTDNEHCVFQAFLKKATMDTERLKTLSGVDKAPQILRDLTTRYNGIFAPAITLPGRRGAGGYHVKIATI